MKKIESFFLLVFNLIALLLTSSVMYAQAPSALVLEKSGASVPEVRPYSEIPVGTTLSLRSATKLVFLHYYTCQTVAVIGSTIGFEQERYIITGGKKESETRSPCPRKLALRVGGEVGGIMVRSTLAGVTLKFSSQPGFVLVGKRADDFASVRVFKEDKKLLETPLDGRRFRWPTDAAALAPGDDYQMVLTPKVSGAPSVKIGFFVTPSSESPASEAMVLISVE